MRDRIVKWLPWMLFIFIAASSGTMICRNYIWDGTDWIKQAGSSAGYQGVVIYDSGSGATAQVNSDGQLHTVMQGKIDPNNSTEDLLGIGGVFTGTGTDISNYASISLLVHSDVASASGGLVVQFSDDNSDWHNGENYTIPAGDTKFFTPPVQSLYYRVIYTNGGTGQSDFHIHAMLHKVPIKWSSHNVNNTLYDEDDGQLVVSVPKLRTAANTYVSMAATSNGNAKVSLEEFEDQVSSNSNTQLNVTQFLSNGNEGISFADSGNLDSFGALRVSSKYTIFDSKQVNSNHIPLFWDNEQVSGSGTTSIYTQNRASTTLRVSNTTAGKRVRQTYRRFNYQPDKSQRFIMTFIAGSNGSGTTKELGLFDDNNGMFFRMDSGTPYIVTRSSSSGSPVDSAVAQANWSEDPMDGNGPSGITLDFSKSQIFFCDFEWLGVGRQRFGWVVDGKLYYCHYENNTNNKDVVYTSTPNLPLRWSIENGGSGTTETLETVCCSISSEGGFDPNGVVRTYGTRHLIVDANTSGTYYATVGIRLKSDSLGATIIPNGVDIGISTTGDVAYWELRLNPTVAGTFNYSDLEESSVQYAVGDTTGNPSTNTVTGGYILDSGFATQSSPAVGLSLKSNVRIGAAIDGTRDTLVLCVTPLEGDSNMDISGNLGWREVE